MQTETYRHALSCQGVNIHKYIITNVVRSQRSRKSEICLQYSAVEMYVFIYIYMVIKVISETPFSVVDNQLMYLIRIWYRLKKI